MWNKTFLMCIAVLFLINASGLFAQDAGLSEQYKQALRPNSVQKSPLDPQQRQSRGKGKVVPESQLNNTGISQPSLTMQLEFKFNSDELAPQTVKYLDALGTALQDKELRGYIYKIEGHTDNVGSDAYNLELSRKRALAVADYMVGTFDLERQQFEIQGFGKSKSIASNDTEAGRQQNRRVEIINTLKAFDASFADRPDIVVQVKYTRAKQEKELRDGGTLTQRDGYAVEFTPKTSAHVYVYQVDSMGKEQQLFPNPEFSQSYGTAEPGRLYRVPDFGKWFVLDENKGKEHIVVIAQKEELKDPLEICKREIGTAGGMALASNRVPEKSKNTTRGMIGVRKDDEPAKDSIVSNRSPDKPAEIDMNKVFVWKLSFLHQ
jgi:outer membrane protein OmpA-like peptidoglycan-associated protein